MVAWLPSLVQPQQICKHRRASLVERRMTVNQERHGVRFSQTERDRYAMKLQNAEPTQESVASKK